jgi:hypothetical protein
MGVEFSQPLRLDDDGRIAAVAIKSTLPPPLDPAANQRKVG